MGIHYGTSKVTLVMNQSEFEAVHTTLESFTSYVKEFVGDDDGGSGEIARAELIRNLKFKFEQNS